MNDVEIKDIDKLKNLLIEFGLPYKKEKLDDGCTYLTLKVDYCPPDCKIDGYNGFYSSFSFNNEGNFIKVNIGE